MKTVYKKIAVAITALFVISLSFLPFTKRAKAADDNTPTQSPNYNFTLINLPLDFYFTNLTGSADYYYPTYMRFQIYNTDNPDLGGASTMDRLDCINKSGSTTTKYLTAANSLIKTAFIHQTSLATPADSPRFVLLELNYTRETSETISGVMTSYVMDTSELDSTLHINKGFSITFNFEAGYKKYTFTTSSLSCVFYSANTNPLPRTYPLSVSSSNDIQMYLTAKQEGYNEGYNAGYSTGEEAGKKSGYTTGYNKGYNDGRIAPEYSFKEFFIGLGDAFVTIWTGMLNFEFLGVNIAGLIGTILVVCLVVFIVKIVKGA